MLDVTTRLVLTTDDALQAIRDAWSQIRSECLSVLGSELHYQAMIYHALRVTGAVPVSQLGMNVKMWLPDPISGLFQKLNEKKHPLYRGGFEPIPDVVIFSPSINSDWRRRNRQATLQHALAVIEVKASERAGSRLQSAEVELDIQKLSAHREEARHRGSDFLPAMIVIDSAPLERERMRPQSIARARELASKLGVIFIYVSPSEELFCT